MTDTTVNLGLPVIAAAQAQKHVTHNEALVMIDELMHLAVVSRAASAPPASPAPVDGQLFIVGPGPSGAWQGFAENDLVALRDGAWVAHSKTVGMRAYVIDEDGLVRWNGSAWADVAASFPIAEARVLGRAAGTGAGAATALTVAQLLAILGSDWASWTPVFTAQTVGDLAVTYHDRHGRYRRLGNQVTAECYLDVTIDSLTGASGMFRIGGLPIAPVNNSGISTWNAGGRVIRWRGTGNNPPTLSGGRTQIWPIVAIGPDTIQIQQLGSALNDTQLLVTDFVVGNRYVIHVAVDYEVDP